MTRACALLAAAGVGLTPALRGQTDTPATFAHTTARYGKWLTAGAAIAFTVMAANEHSRSAREWDNLLALCRSAEDACALAPDGQYQRADAEALYRRSLRYDERANRRLLGAQASLLVTAALFIIDLSGRSGRPDNIPVSPIKVTVEPTRDGAAVGMRIAF